MKRLKSRRHEKIEFDVLQHKSKHVTSPCRDAEVFPSKQGWLIVTAAVEVMAGIDLLMQVIHLFRVRRMVRFGVAP